MSIRSMNSLLLVSLRKFRAVCGSGLMLLATAAVWAQADLVEPYYFTTIAGTWSAGSTDGQGSAARFSAPAGIVVDGQGNIFVTDTLNKTIRKVTSAGVVSTLAGKPGYEGITDGIGSEARFSIGGSLASGIARDALGNLYVTDRDKYTVRKVSLAGVVTTLAGLAGTSGSADGTGSAARFTTLGGAVVGPAGDIYAIDGNAIRKITPAGVVTTLAGTVDTRGSADGTGSAAQLNGFVGITADAAGNLFVLGDLNGTIRRITPAGVVTTMAAAASTAQFDYPGGIAVDSTGNFFVCDGFNHTIRKISAAGVVTTIGGTAGVAGHADGAGNVALFSFPAGIAFDQAGNLYVGDSGNNAIRKITPGGIVSTVAGLSPMQCVGHVDDTGSAARFDDIAGVVIDSTGALFVADAGNSTIRKVSAAGVVTTFAGLAGTAGYADGPGSAARFDRPSALAIDASDTIYVADANNFVVRKITPTGSVSTYAGQPGQGHNIDGPAGTALLAYTTSLAIDANNNVYLTTNTPLPAVRKISRAGEITTLYALTGTPWYDGLSTLAVNNSGNILARLSPEHGLLEISPAGKLISTAQHLFPPPDGKEQFAVDRAGNAFSCGQWAVIAKTSPTGANTSLGGLPYAWGNSDGLGQDARFGYGVGVGAVDAAGNIYVFDESSIRKGQRAGPPLISTQPLSQTVAPGASAQFSVAAGGLPVPTYQWNFNGSPFNGATSNTLSFANARSTDAGDYTVVVTNSLGSVTSNKATLTVSAATVVTPPPTPAPAASSGGGGSIEGWFVLMLMALVAVRCVAIRALCQ